MNEMIKKEFTYLSEETIEFFKREGTVLKMEGKMKLVLNQLEEVMDSHCFRFTLGREVYEVDITLTNQPYKIMVNITSLPADPLQFYNGYITKSDFITFDFVYVCLGDSAAKENLLNGLRDRLRELKLKEMFIPMYGTLLEHALMDLPFDLLSSLNREKLVNQLMIRLQLKKKEELMLRMHYAFSKQTENDRSIEFNGIIGCSDRSKNAKVTIPIKDINKISKK